jgi:ankyrin repeat protein
VCLIERCRTPQNGIAPLHVAAQEGHATVVEQLLAAGAVTDPKTKVRRVGDEE